MKRRLGFEQVESREMMAVIAVADAQPREEGQPLVFPVTLNAPSNRTVTVDYTTVSDQARSGSDYTGHNGRITFAPGETRKEVTVQTTLDTLVEGTERMGFRLSNASRRSSIGDSRAEGLIRDSSTPPPDDPPDDPPTDPPPTPSGDLTVTPFLRSSPFNAPIPAGTTYGSPLGSRVTGTVNGGVATIQTSGWGTAVNYAKASDPVVRLTFTTAKAENYSGRSVDINLPANLVRPTGGDGHVVVIAPDGVTAHEFYALNVSTRHATTYRVTDLRGSGVDYGDFRATDMSGLAGLLRVYDLNLGSINHALQIGLPKVLLSNNWQFPANAKDSPSVQGQGSNTGSINYGARLAIPKSVNLSSLGLSAGGLMFAKALQQYGAYVVDTTVSVPSLIYGEYHAANHPMMSQMKSDYTRIMSLIAVTNP